MFLALKEIGYGRVLRIHSLLKKQGQATNYLFQQFFHGQWKYPNQNKTNFFRMTYSKGSPLAIKWMFAQIADNKSILFVHVIVPDSKKDTSSISSNIMTASSRLWLVSLSCTSSFFPLAMFNGELYKIAGSLNLKLLISS